MIFKIPELPDKFVEVIDRIDIIKKSLRAVLSQQPKRWTGVLRRSTFARAIQASNTIEGYNVTMDDALAAVDEEAPPDQKTEDWLALNGYRSAMSYILQLADDPFYRHNEGTIRSLHYMMTGYDIAKHPGRWRPGTIFVRRQPENKIVYEGPGVDMVHGLMTELVDSLNRNPTVPAIVTAAMAHLNLVMIHPFSDGNGRMGRALQTFVLAREGILDANFCSIEEYIGRFQQDYYAVLGKVGQGSWHPENNPLPWIKFCLTAHYKQAEALVRRTEEIAKLWEIIENEIKRRGINDRTIVALANAAMGFRTRNSDYRKAAEVSEQVASRDLHVLAQQGLLFPVGEKRGRHYIAGDWLKGARIQTRQTKSVSDPFGSSPQTTSRAANSVQAKLPGLNTKR
jgi:Fic family protein